MCIYIGLSSYATLLYAAVNATLICREVPVKDQLIRDIGMGLLNNAQLVLKLTKTIG